MLINYLLELSKIDFVKLWFVVLNLGNTTEMITNHIGTVEGIEKLGRITNDNF